MRQRNMRSPNKSGIVYAEHDGTKLVGDLYLPKGRAKAPVLVAIHGGGWQGGSTRFYWYWGLFLARNGYAVFAIDYRVGKAGAYPAAVYDAKAAVQFVRAKAADFDIDPDRIGLIGDSAGGHLAALLALAGDQYTTAYRDDANAAIPANVKAVVAFYGVYDMLAQWTHELTATRTTTSWKNSSAPRRCRTGASTSKPRRSAMRLSIITTCASCLSTAPTTTSSIRRASRAPS